MRLLLPSSPPLPSPSLFFFFFNDTATTEIYTLSLHDALPISRHVRGIGSHLDARVRRYMFHRLGDRMEVAHAVINDRSEEHTSELQSLTNLVCRLLLEKKKEHV